MRIQNKESKRSSNMISNIMNIKRLVLLLKSIRDDKKSRLRIIQLSQHKEASLSFTIMKICLKAVIQSRLTFRWIDDSSNLQAPMAQKKVDLHLFLIKSIASRRLEQQVVSVDYLSRLFWIHTYVYEIHESCIYKYLNNQKYLYIYNNINIKTSS